MNLAKTRTGILIPAALLALPAAFATWWMLSPPQPPGQAPERAGDPLPASGSKEAEIVAHGRLGSEAADAMHSQPTIEADAAEIRTYAAGLRTKGVPEATVRELVASRITASFEPRRRSLRSIARRPGSDAAATDRQLAALNALQEALITQLVGTDDPSAEASAVEARLAATEGQVLMPAAMSEAAPEMLRTDAQAAALGKVRQDFADAVNAGGESPASPGYRRRWISAGNEADQRFRLLFGDNAFVQHQMQAYREAQLRAQGRER